MNSFAGEAGAKAKPSLADIVIAAACGLSLTSTAIALLVLPLRHSFAGSRDLAIFWATAHQLIHHANPWNAQAVGALEHSAGFTGHGSYFMRNPPWALLLILPLGFFSARVDALPWSLLLLAVLAAALGTLWKTFGRPRSPIDWLGYCFPPALICAAMGQTSLFALLGLALFLRFHGSRPFWAGAALWFCTLKPHLFLPFGVALLLWIVISRNYRIVLGAVSALAVTSLLVTALDPAAWTQYLDWARHSGISNEAVPCLAVALRARIDLSASWLDFLPAVVACLWAVGYFWPRRQSWDWLDHGGLLLLVSLVVAPYCWINDQCLALPALLLAASRTSSRGLLATLGGLCFLVAFQVFAVGHLDSSWYLWPAPAWLAWYLFAHASVVHSVSDQRPVLT
ncbi:MAG TPA: glycosyltransferase family 87 protein [Acidobacteriaceae bacterium]|nr:glycosyltransferase family 87 protein [Acidobacteriaceae bacterium]